MKDITLYAYSTDKKFLHTLKTLLVKVEAKVSTYHDESALEKAVKTQMPSIVLLDDIVDDEHPTSFSELLVRLIPQELRGHRGHTSIAVLCSEGKDTEYKVVDYLFKGGDYIIKKPVTAVELLTRIMAMVRHRRYIEEYIHDYNNRTQQISMFEAMDNVLEYTNTHIRPIAEKIIDTTPNTDSNQVVEYITESKKGAAEIIAAINALREEVSGLVSTQSNTLHDYESLDELFNKHLELINLAYNVKWSREE